MKTDIKDVIPPAKVPQAKSNKVSFIGQSLSIAMLVKLNVPYIENPKKLPYNKVYIIPCFPMVGFITNINIAPAFTK